MARNGRPPQRIRGSAAESITSDMARAAPQRIRGQKTEHMAMRRRAADAIARRRRAAVAGTSNGGTGGEGGTDGEGGTGGNGGEGGNESDGVGDRIGARIDAFLGSAAAERGIHGYVQRVHLQDEVYVSYESPSASATRFMDLSALGVRIPDEVLNAMIVVILFCEQLEAPHQLLINSTRHNPY